MNKPYATAILSLFVFLAYLQGANSEERFYNYLGSKAEGGRLFTSSPPEIRIGFKGGKSDKRSFLFSVINSNTQMGGLPLEMSSGTDVNFIAAFFMEGVITDAGISVPLLTEQRVSPSMIEYLKKAYFPGKQCVTSSIFNMDGVYLGSFLVANESAKISELADCALEISANVFGIEASRGIPAGAFGERFALVNKMVQARADCLSEGNSHVECAEAKLGQ